MRSCFMADNIFNSFQARQYLSIFISLAFFTWPRNDFTAAWSVAGFFFPCSQIKIEYCSQKGKKSN